MLIPLTYAAKTREPWGRLARGVVAATVSLLAAAVVGFYAVSLARQQLSQASSWCGTGRYDAFTTLWSVLPFGLLVPLMGWHVAHRARYGEVGARCGLWIAATCWGIALLFSTLR